MATQPAHTEPATAGTILHRIGLFGNRSVGEADAGDTVSAASLKAERRARRRLVNDIRSFLLEHDLEITPASLASAHEACAGLNPALNRAIEARKLECMPLTMQWLAEVSADSTATGDRAVKDLAKKLEHGIDQLSRATKNVRLATTEYGDELERRVDDLSGTLDQEQMIAGLADFAKAMLARSRQTEEELRKSELETARLRENLDRARRDAEVDYLTGLPNRRAFEAVLNAEYAEGQASGLPLCVAFCDIDRFKAINDTHGHEAGDRILRVVAQTLASGCREDCYIARHGGEEFAMLFRGVGPAEALARLDTAREELAQRRMINRRTDKPFGIVTFSGGIAEVSSFADPRDALAAADAALYRAKEDGRNRILIAEDVARVA